MKGDDDPDTRRYGPWIVGILTLTLILGAYALTHGK